MLRVGALGAVLLLWAALFADTLRWFLHVPFQGGDRRLNLGLLILFVALIAYRAGQRRVGPWVGAAPWSTSLQPWLRGGPLLLLLVATGLHVGANRALQPSTLSALLMGAATYGLWGLYCPPQLFRGGVTGFLLLLSALPFAALADSYLGLWARMLTAGVVAQILHALHVSSVSTQTILVLERGIAHVDIPCSGLRGLWSGLICYLLLTWLDRRRLGGRWLFGLLATQLLLLLANIARVTVLICLALAAGAPRLAEALHVPLGLLGFAMGCAFAVLYLRLCVPLQCAPNVNAIAAHGGAGRASTRADRALLWLLPLTLGVLCVVARRMPQHVATPAALALSLPADLGAVPVELSPGEREIFGRFGAHAQKWRLSPAGSMGVPRSGSLIVVYAPAASAFRAHHPPEVCLLGDGLRVTNATDVWLDDRARVRRLALQRGEQRVQQNAEHGAGTVGLYWFQAAHDTTPDIVTRIYRQLRDRRPWVLVTLLLDEPTTARAGQWHGSTADSPDTDSADDVALRVARRIHETVGEAVRNAERRQGSQP